LVGAVDIAAVDLDGDGVPEMIALAQSGVFVYKYSTTSQTYLQTHNYPVAATNLLVADTHGDGVPEIFVLAAASPVGQGNGTITELSSTLQLMNTYTVAGATSLYLEQSTFPRKNLVVAVANPSLVYSQASKIAVVDPTTGTLIWETPFVSGSVPIHSLSFHDWIGSGQLQMAFGTSAGMYVTR
jgi:outer membrane protein assembly factor BamB